MTLPIEQRWSFILLAAIWFGMAAGMAEVAMVELKSISDPIRKPGPDFIWMAPAALTGLFIAAAAALSFAGKLSPRFDTRRIAVFTFATLGLFGLLAMIPGFHHVAALLLAAGIGTQLTKLIGRSLEGFRRLCVRTLPLLVLAMAAPALWAQLPGGSEQTMAAGNTAAPAGAPNVLFITLDTVRAQSMSVYGHSRRTTPHLEALAASGVTFNRALSTASWTLPSHASMFTGRWPHELSADYNTPLDSSHTTLAEILSRHGYATAGFVANLGYCGAQTGLARGFEHYEDYPLSLGQIASSSTLIRVFANNFRLRKLIENDEHLTRKSADVINRDLLRWLDGRAAQETPFFIFANYFDAHDPYLPPPPFDTMFGPGRSRGKHSPLHHWLYNPAAGHFEMDKATVQEELDAYEGAIAYLDDRIGQLLEALRDRKLLDNTLVVITSDHGEEFGEHGVFEHSYSLYLPSVHVPLVISLPRTVPAGTRIDEPASLRDISATVLDLIGIRSDDALPGASLVRHWDDDSTNGLTGEALLSELNHVAGQPDWFPVSKGNMKAVVQGGRRYIRNGNGVEELYDFDHDPAELDNLAGMEDEQQTLQRMKSILDMIVNP